MRLASCLQSCDFVLMRHNDRKSAHACTLSSCWTVMQTYISRQHLPLDLNEGTGDGQLQISRIFQVPTCRYKWDTPTRAQHGIPNSCRGMSLAWQHQMCMHVPGAPCPVALCVSIPCLLTDVRESDRHAYQQLNVFCSAATHAGVPGLPGCG